MEVDVELYFELNELKDLIVGQGEIFRVVLGRGLIKNPCLMADKVESCRGVESFI